MKKKDFRQTARQAFGTDDIRADDALATVIQKSRAQFEGTKTLKGARYISIEKIRPNPNQPRKKIPKETLQELADSIREHGILQPIIVEYIEKDNYFRIMFGERRYRAAQLAGLSEIPCIIKEIDNEVRLLAQQFIENIHREDLSPIEKARGLLELKEKMGADTQWKDVEAITGLHERRRRQFLALLDLPEDIQRTIVSLGSQPSKNQVTEGHARALLKLRNDEKKQHKLFNMILNNDQPISSQMAMDLAREMLGDNSAQKKRITFQYESIPELIGLLKQKIIELENMIKG